MEKTILVVDDEPQVRWMIQEMLETQGWQVKAVGGWEEAMQILTSFPSRIILSDIRMPGKTGLELLRLLRQAHPTSVILLMTGFPEMDTVQEALREGAFDYLAKPILPEVLFRAVDRALEYQTLWEERERDRNRLEAIFRSLGEAVITLDDHGILLQVNDAAREVVGLDDTLLGQHLEQAAPLFYEEIQPSLTELFASGKPSRGVRAVLNEGGKERILQCTLTPLREGRNPKAGAVVVARDETRLLTLEREVRNRPGFQGMVGASQAMQEVYTLLDKLGDVNSTVLITGETGTGKELAARALHDLGKRRAKPFVAVNCAALNEELLESELFGHVKGAFTHALRDKPGRFKLADGGTIFLDEIGEISANVQVRLLRVLQERCFEPVGDWRTVKVDVRVVAATNRHLRERVAQGLFREDLFFRLNVVNVAMPPLRARREDIPLLVSHALGQFNRKLEKNVTGVTPELMRLLMRHPWPGNVRELINVLEHGTILCRGERIGIEDMPEEMIGDDLNGKELDDMPEINDEIRQALVACRWRVGEAAKHLGISRSTLWRKMRALRISPP